jgi:hypothetical protein
MGWKDSEGDDCRTYAQQGYCTSDGKFGVAWGDDWGPFSDYAVDGKHAGEVCCSCGGGSRCTDQTDWKDNEADGCHEYAARSYCKPDATPGTGWQSDWGPLADYAPSGGVDATIACCAFGRGGTHTSAPICVDYNGWVDNEGDSCQVYGSQAWCKQDGTAGPGWQSDWGALDSFAINGVGPLQACCVCGGGTASRNPAEVPFDTGCRDIDGWMDVEGDTCETYAKSNFCTITGGIGYSWETEWGSIDSYAVDTIGALQACCRCGGGSTHLSGAQPTPAGCVNVPGFADTEGDGCAAYAAGHWCDSMNGGTGPGWEESWGTIQSYATNGKSAFDECCVCGGGRPAESLPPKECVDKSYWVDSEGDSCAVYESSNFCTRDGKPGSGWVADWGPLEDYAKGVSALAACCVCGGGVSSKPLTFAGCTDAPSWQDNEGDDCQAYGAGRWCTEAGALGVGWESEWGAIETYRGDGKTAFEACCACGGGTRGQSATATAITTNKNTERKETAEHTSPPKEGGGSSWMTRTVFLFSAILLGCFSFVFYRVHSRRSGGFSSLHADEFDIIPGGPVGRKTGSYY